MRPCRTPSAAVWPGPSIIPIPASTRSATISCNTGRTSGLDCTRDTVGPLFTPQAVIAAVLDRRADVGPVDGWYLDILRRNDPDATAGLRVVATTEPAPIPLLVGHPELPEPELFRLRRAFLDAGRVPSLSPVLEALLVREFAVPEPRDYDVLPGRARAAIGAGYPEPS